MKKVFPKNIAALMLAGALLAGCQTGAVITQHSGGYLPVDSTLDATPDPEAVALIAPYKHKVDSIMNHVIGRTSVAMDRTRPESPLSNLVADVLRASATEVLGHEADMGLVNMGGIRSSLPLGDLTTANIFEILPFENSLCVLTLRGTTLLQLFHEIAKVGGEGVSGINLRINSKGELLDARIGGKPVDESALYTLATVDYLADGNDRLPACLQAEKRECPAGMTLRDLFMGFVKTETKAGRAIKAEIEGRIVIDETN